jgi:hypothetical protein
MRLSTAAAAFAITASSFLPAQAVQMPAAPSFSSDTAVTDVQYRRHWRDDRRGGYYNGHRGYRDRRPGYRYHNGMWFPLAAFGAGALIGGAIASQPRGGSHSSWCESRYRTYRASDNTYVASGGVRRTCVSPN